MSIYPSYRVLEGDLSDFRSCISELNRKIHDAGDLWKDEKYRELRDSVSRIASDSRAIFNKSDQCRSAVDCFMNVCKEY